MNSSLTERITRLLAFMLRHQPEQFDLEVDAFGFADLEDVLDALSDRFDEDLDEEVLREAIEAGDRPRYEIQSGRIRALYGHSIAVEPGEPSKPPELLYVGLSRRDAERAKSYGLRGGRRRFLHLALTTDDAMETGRRAGPEYNVITIRALDAWEDGINFYDRKSLFLAEEIPTHLLEVGPVHTDGFEEREEDGPRGRQRGRGRSSDEEREPSREPSREREREPARAASSPRSESSTENSDRSRSRRRGGRGRGRSERSEERSERRGPAQEAEQGRSVEPAERGDRGERSAGGDRGERVEGSGGGERVERSGGGDRGGERGGRGGERGGRGGERGGRGGERGGRGGERGGRGGERGGRGGDRGGRGGDRPPVGAGVSGSRSSDSSRSPDRSGREEPARGTKESAPSGGFGVGVYGSERGSSEQSAPPPEKRRDEPADERPAPPEKKRPLPPKREEEPPSGPAFGAGV